MSENSKDIEKWLKLINADGVGPVTFKKILEKCGPVEQGTLFDSCLEGVQTA
jgi:predicted Rossmann fold nucleotide-binding protein DprA/Smf involved in DNA uptake